MKFVLLTQCYAPEIGGAQVLMGSLASELRRHGHDVRVVTALPNYPTGKIFDAYKRRFIVREEIDEIPVFRSWIYAEQSASLLPRLLSYLSFCLTSLFSLRWIGKPDVIFVDSPPLFLCVSALLMARIKGSAWVMNVSDLWPDAVADSGLVRSGLLLNIARKLERFLYGAADFVSSVTEGVCRILIEDKDVPRKKLLFLPIGVDTALFRPQPPNQELLKKWKLKGKAVFTYAGRIGHSQGLELMVQVADSLRSRPDIAFVLLGDGPVKQELQLESQRLGLNNILFVDPVPLSEMPRWWSISRGAIVTLKDQPIHLSARPSKSFTAMASGVPVVFSGVGEMERIIVDTKAGLVAPPEKVADLAQQVVRLTDDPELARELGENGRLLCEREYGWQLVVGNWLRAMALQSQTFGGSKTASDFSCQTVEQNLEERKIADFNRF